MAARALVFVVRAAAAVALLWFILEYFGAGQVFATLHQLDFGWYALALMVAVAQIYLTAWRWRLLYRALTDSTPYFRDLVLGVARSLVVGQLLPTAIGADAVRAASLTRSTGIAAAARSVTCDRLLGLFVLLLMVSAELPFLAAIATSRIPVLTLAAATLAAIAGFAVVVALRRVFRRVPFVGRVLHTVADDFLRSFVHPSGRHAFALAILVHLSSAMLFALVVRSVDPGASLTVSVLVILPALLVLSVPISLGGWGVREAAVVSGFSLLGADALPAVAASILFGVSVVLGAAITEFAVSMFWPKQTPRAKTVSDAA